MISETNQRTARKARQRPCQTALRRGDGRVRCARRGPSQATGAAATAGETGGQGKAPAGRGVSCPGLYF